MVAVERSTELRLPTIAVPVRLALVGGEPVTAALFVADVARTGARLADHIAELVDDAAPFVPARVDTTVKLLAKHAIAWIAVDRADEPEDDTLYDHEHRVDVALVGGATLTGSLLDSAPADRPRVVDHLNRSGAFVRLWTPSEHYLVNKAQILHVTEL
jgi:hypothetical protein